MPAGTEENFTELLRTKADWVRKETLLIHRSAKETRIASSLSCADILAVLYYGGIVKFNPEDLQWEGRDRLIISKGHGGISLYPILADLGFFDKSELGRVCKEGTFLGGIPDAIIPGFETINGSLGHGLGVASGIAIALKKKGRKEKVIALLGDGELYEGSVWEALMFAGEHRLDNLMMIVDRNRGCMLDYCANIIDLDPLVDKFRTFKWQTETVDGHDVSALYESLSRFKNGKSEAPFAVIADTVKGKGVPRLEIDPLSHIKNLSPDEVDELIARL
jgi:transketolase